MPAAFKVLLSVLQREILCEMVPCIYKLYVTEPLWTLPLGTSALAYLYILLEDNHPGKIRIVAMRVSAVHRTNWNVYKHNGDNEKKPISFKWGAKILGCLEEIFRDKGKSSGCTGYGTPAHGPGTQINAFLKK